jgi:uncharacterized membrane protein
MTRRFRSNLFRQGGAIGILGVVTLMLALLFTALVVDSGRLWMQQRHLQTIADIASIQGARQLTCNVTAEDVLPQAQAAAAANGYDGNLADSPNVVEMVNITTDASGVRQYTSGGDEAVRVYATRTVPASLVLGGLFGNTVTLNAEAVSRADPAIAAFSSGTFAARIDTENSVLLNALLGELLGSSLSLDVLSYKGIANTHITLNDLLAASGQVGGLESLLDTSMSVADLMSIMATAVAQSGTADAAAVSGMNQIASAAISNATIKLGDLLDITTPDAEAAGKVGLNALSLITSTALIANGNSAISLPLAVSVPQIASIDAQVDIIQPPRIAIGPIGNDGDGNLCTTLTTAQVEASVNVNTDLSLAGIGVHLDLALAATVAQGSAGLSDIQAGNDSVQVNIDANPGIASVNLSNASGAGGARVYATLPLVGYAEIATLSMNVPVQPPTPETLVFDVAMPVAENLPQTQTVDSPLGDSLANALDAPIQVSALSVSNLPLVNAVVDPIISNVLNLLVTPIVKPLVLAIGDAFLEPLFELLGLQLGGMDVTLQGIQIRQPEPLII